jgi:calcineurin-like phosphoesterase family protein
MTVFFTADTHFGHGGALGLYRRPFASVAEMDRALENLWNETVGPEDEVWHLGDFAVGRRDPGPLLARLHGRKRLVVGNNDGPATCDLPGWENVVPYAEVTVEGVQLVLCHYPFRTWRGSGKGWLNLHGHSHGRLSRLTRQHDVGVDARGFRPVTLAELVEPRR